MSKKRSGGVSKMITLMRREKVKWLRIVEGIIGVVHE
jgi:hypothetical protein